MSSAIFGFLGVIQVGPGGRRDRLGSMGSSGYALRLNGLIRGRWVQSGAPWGRRDHPCSPWGSSDSLGVVGFILVRSMCGGVYLAPFSLFGCALWIVGFIGCGLVHLVEPWWSSGLFRVVWVSRVRPAGRRFNSVSWNNSGVLSVSSGSFGVVVFIRVRPRGGPVHSEWLGSCRCALRVVGFIRSFGFIRVRLQGRHVHSGSLN